MVLTLKMWVEVFTSWLKIDCSTVIVMSLSSWTKPWGAHTLRRRLLPQVFTLRGLKRYFTQKFDKSLAGRFIQRTPFLLPFDAFEPWALTSKPLTRETGLSCLDTSFDQRRKKTSSINRSILYIYIFSIHFRIHKQEIGLKITPVRGAYLNKIMF